jgi:hypothetical protein
VFAQDERFFRKLFSGELEKSFDTRDQKKYSYNLYTPEYALDLNNDKLSEYLVAVRRDSEDWLDIFNSYKERIFQYRFVNSGPNSSIYRVQRKMLDQKTTLLLIYYFEGENNYTIYESSARLYLMTIPHNDLTKISIYKGPSIFEEYRSLKQHYHIRDYQLGVLDLNNDGIKEVMVKYRNMSEVYFYTGDGKWQSFRKD